MRSVYVLAGLVAAALPALAQQDAASGAQRFGAWSVHCAGEAGGEPACEVLHAVRGQSGIAAQLAIGQAQPGGRTRIAVQTPLGVLVSRPVALSVAEAGAALAELPFVTCLGGGCLAQGEIDGGALGAIAGGETARFAFVERTGRRIEVVAPGDGLAEALRAIGHDCSSGTCRPAP